MTDAQRKVLGSLHAHAFNEPSCKPSQELLAKETGFSRRYVIRVLKELRDAGHISWTHERRPGCKWHHNVYCLRDWSPPLRKTLLARLREIRASSGLVHTEGTARTRALTSSRARRGAYVVGKDNRDLATKRMSASHEKTDSDCGRCVELEEERIDLIGENTRQGTEIAGLQNTARTLGAQLVALRNELNRVREEEPESDDIKELLALWRDECKAGAKRFQIDATGPRGKQVKWALKKFGKERCTNAILGTTLDDWAMGRLRKSGGREFNDIAKHILKDEETIERFEGLWLGRGTPKPAPVHVAPVGPPAIDRVLDKLEGVRQERIGQWMARCPAHEDRNASLAVGVGAKGLVAHCNAGCAVDDIARAVGVPLTEWFDAEPAAVPIVKTPEALPSPSVLAGWQAALRTNTKLLDRLKAVKGWSLETLVELGVGWNGRRLVFPIHDRDGSLSTLALYLPNGKPKMLGLRHRDRGLFPTPVVGDPRDVWLVEGEPDAVSGHELGLHAIGVPGSNGWRPVWASWFAERSVVVCFDCDDPGRKAAERVVESIQSHAAEVRVVDLDQQRTDGFDLSDFLIAGGTREELLRRVA